ncbi:MAG: hypothetical protein ABR981_01585 [Candidatus Micrarchaeaceae archaeon]
MVTTEHNKQLRPQRHHMVKLHMPKAGPLCNLDSDEQPKGKVILSALRGLVKPSTIVGLLGIERQSKFEQDISFKSHAIGATLNHIEGWKAKDPDQKIINLLAAKLRYDHAENVIDNIEGTTPEAREGLRGLIRHHRTGVIDDLRELTGKEMNDTNGDSNVKLPLTAATKEYLNRKLLEYTEKAVQYGILTAIAIGTGIACYFMSGYFDNMHQNIARDMTQDLVGFSVGGTGHFLLKLRGKFNDIKTFSRFSKEQWIR